jgi:ribosome-binding factor A
MPKEFSRMQRLGAQIQRELAPLVRERLDLPGSRLLTISEVQVTPDLSLARVFVSSLDEDGQRLGEVMAALKAMSGELRHVLARRLTVRTIPRLDFSMDEAAQRGARLTALIARAVADDRRHAEARGETEDQGSAPAEEN